MIELSHNIDRDTVELAYKRSKQAQMRNTYGARRWSQKAFHHALNRDPKIMAVLEKASEIMNSIWEEQLGNYSRDESIAESHRRKPIEVQLWTEAYRVADEGHALGNFKWIYHAAYELAYGWIVDQ
jgi:hypothetical protein